MLTEYIENASTYLETLSTPPVAGHRRAIGLNLVVFFFFALTAVIFLTRTEVAANAINRDVATSIEPSVAGIKSSTVRLPVLDKTVAITGQIQSAAKPLSVDLSGVVSSTTRIADNLTSTDNHVQSIDASVAAIKNSTGVVRGAVALLGGRVSTIQAEASSIAGDFLSVAGMTSSMVGNLAGADSALTNVLRDAGPLSGVAGDIRSRLGSVNAQTARIESSPLLLRDASQLTSLLGNLLGVL